MKSTRTGKKKQPPPNLSRMRVEFLHPSSARSCRPSSNLFRTGFDVEIRVSRDGPNLVSTVCCGCIHGMRLYMRSFLRSERGCSVTQHHVSVRQSACTHEKEDLTTSQFCACHLKLTYCVQQGCDRVTVSLSNNPQAFRSSPLEPVSLLVVRSIDARRTLSTRYVSLYESIPCA